MRVRTGLGALAVLAILSLLVWMLLNIDSGGELGMPPSAHAEPGPVLAPEPDSRAATQGHGDMAGGAAESRTRLGLQVQVVDAEGRPVPSARVFTRDLGQSAVVLGVTGGDGVTTVTATPFPSMVGAWAAGRQPMEASVAEGAEHVTLVLREGASIQGRVFWEGGGPLGQDGLVACWPSGHRPQSLADDRQSVPSWAVVPTDESGGFVITGLDPGMPYTLIAVGPWAVMSEPLDGVLPGPAPLSLLVSALYGLVLRITGPGGAPLLVDPQLGVWGKSVDRELGRGFALNSPALELLGLDIKADPDGSRVEHLLYTARSSFGAVGPFNVSARMPGYGSVTEDLLVPRVTSAELPTHDLELERLAKAFGVLQIRLEGVTDGAEPSGARDNLGVIRLQEVRDDDLDASSWLCAVKPGQTEVFLGTLPSGLWDVSWRPGIRVPGVTRIEPAVRAHVTESVAAEVVLQAGDNGILEIEIVESSGQAYTGSASFNLHHGGQASCSSVSFEKAPFLVGVVPPGEYTLSVTCPSPGGPSGPRSTPFSVLAGETTQVTVSRP